MFSIKRHKSAIHLKCLLVSSEFMLVILCITGHVGCMGPTTWSCIHILNTHNGRCPGALSGVILVDALHGSFCYMLGKSISFSLCVFKHVYLNPGAIYSYVHTFQRSIYSGWWYAHSCVASFDLHRRSTFYKYYTDASEGRGHSDAPILHLVL